MSTVPTTIETTPTPSEEAQDRTLRGWAQRRERRALWRQLESLFQERTRLFRERARLSGLAGSADREANTDDEEGAR